MKKEKIVATISLIGIFLLALSLRFYRLDLNTPELYTDEVGHFYLLGQIANFSSNVLNATTNLVFTATWFLGLTPLGVRFYPALYSSVIVIVGYFFAKSLSSKGKTSPVTYIAIVYSLLLAILPWNFIIGRIGHTHVPIVVLTMLWHLYLYLDSKSTTQKLWSYFPLVLGSYFYPNMILMLPITAIVPFKEIIWDKTKNKKQVFIVATVLVLLLFSFLDFKYKIFDIRSRGLDLAIWRDVNVTADSNFYRGIARQTEPSIFSFNLPPESLSNKLLFNFPVSVLSVFAKNYLSFFSIDNLFLRGDPVLRHTTGMVGNFYLVLLPFMIYGAYKFFSGKTNLDTKLLILLWVLASPIPAAITKDGYGYLLRAITLYPLLTYFCALGLVTLYNQLKSKIAKVTYFFSVSMLLLFSAYYYFFGYFHVYSSLAKDSFEYGFKALSDFQQRTNSSLLITWEDKYPYSQFCFWQHLDYEVCKPAIENTKREIVGQSRVDLPLNNLIFSLPQTEADLVEIVNKYNPRYLALSSRFLKNYPTYFDKLNLVETIKNPDDTVNFYIYKLAKE